MKTSTFYFDLPEKLIAQYPAERREESRMMVLDRKSGAIIHSGIMDFPGLLEPGSLLIFNNTRVRKARLIGTRKDTGGRAEFLLLKELPGRGWEAMVGKSKKHKAGNTYTFPGGMEGTITGTSGSLKLLEFSRTVDDDYLDEHGHVPLPPYIRRQDEPADSERYQTVYSEKTGSVAAPTAGLHFGDSVMQALREREIRVHFVTLHVGIGTFLPVRTENVQDHKMHTESFIIPEETALAVEETKRRGEPVTAVGTTTVRTLESAWTPEGFKRGWCDTDLFIYPGYTFRVVDRLVTNFHVPGSSLLMMVSAFAGTESVKSAYREAVNAEYRFFSYGDVMYIR